MIDWIFFSSKCLEIHGVLLKLFVASSRPEIHASRPEMEAVNKPLQKFPQTLEMLHRLLLKTLQEYLKLL